VKRKRSVKISNVALEPVQWQNDSLQIITSASDLKSMDEFLLKKVTPAVGAPAKSSESSESRWRRQSDAILEAAVAMLIIHVGENFSCIPKAAESAQHAPGLAWDKGRAQCAHTTRAQQLWHFHCFELPPMASEMGDPGGQELKAPGKHSCVHILSLCAGETALQPHVVISCPRWSSCLLVGPHFM